METDRNVAEAGLDGGAAAVSPVTVVEHLVSKSTDIIAGEFIVGLCSLIATNEHDPVAARHDGNPTVATSRRPSPTSVRLYLRKNFPCIARQTSRHYVQQHTTQWYPSTFLFLPDAMVDIMAATSEDVGEALTYECLCSKAPLLTCMALVTLSHNLGHLLREHFLHLPQSYRRQVQSFTGDNRTAKMDAGYLLEVALFGGVIGVIFEGEDPAGAVDHRPLDLLRIDYLYILRPRNGTDLLSAGDAFKLPSEAVQDVLELRHLGLYDLEGLEKMRCPRDHPRRTCAYVSYCLSKGGGKSTPGRFDTPLYLDSGLLTSFSLNDGSGMLHTMEDDDDECSSDDSEAERHTRYMLYRKKHGNSAYQREDGRLMAPRYERPPDSDTESNGSW